MERTPIHFQNPKPKSLSRTIPSSLSALLLPFVFLIPAVGVLFPTSLTQAAGDSRLEKTLLLTYAPDCSPKNNVAERALRKSLALSMEKRSGSAFARINEGAYEGPELPMSTHIVGDYEAYSAKVITLDAVKFTEGADSAFHPPQPVATVTAPTAGGSALGCTVSEESLKRVGVDVLQLVACPLVSVEDVKQALAVDPCVASVEVDQELTVDVFSSGEIHTDVHERPEFYEREKWVEFDGRAITSHSSYTGDADTWTARDDSGRDGKPRTALSQKGDPASTEETVINKYKEHSYRTGDSPLRAKYAGASAVEIQKSTSYQTNARAGNGESSFQQDRARRGGDASPEVGGSTLTNTFKTPAAFAAADASAVLQATAAAGTSTAAAAFAVEEKFPEHDLQAHVFQKMTALEKETQQAASVTAAVFADNRGPTGHGTSPLSFNLTAATGASTADTALPREDSRIVSEFPASIEELFFLHASMSPSKRKDVGPPHGGVPEAQPQSFSSAGQSLTAPSERTAVTAQAEAAPEEEADAAVAAALPARAGESVAQEETLVAGKQQRLSLSRAPHQFQGRDDVNVAYWRSKSGFHTRAYELASCEKNRVIAVIDTGIAYRHPALAANVWVNEGEIPDNDIDDDQNGFIDDVYGYNFRDNSGDPMDDHGHGTHVAGIIGALEYASEQILPVVRRRKRSVTEQHPMDEMEQEQEEQRQEQDGQRAVEEQDEEVREEDQQLRDGQQQQSEGEGQQAQSKQGEKELQKSEHERESQRRHKNRDPRQWVDQNSSRRRNWRVRAQQGVCGETSIAGLKFMGATGNGATSDAIKALNYAVQMNMKLSCNSWGGPSWSEALVAALEAADENGHLFVAAAGNQGKNTDEIPHYPASYQLPNVISVAATNIDDELAPFSNRGAKTVDVAAPGVKILSTFPPDRFKELSGTSMATPVVAGLAAMLMSLPYDNTKQIKDAIMKGVDKIPAVAGLVKSGGRINAEKSVAWLVNELDLDIDFVVQKERLKFALPHFSALFGDTVHNLALARRQTYGALEDDAEEQLFEEEGRGPKAEEAVVDTQKEGRKAQENEEQPDPQHGESRDETKREGTVSSQKPGEKRGAEQEENAPKEAESGNTVPRFLQEKCVSDCVSVASM